jgi:hypothetical protein
MYALVNDFDAGNRVISYHRTIAAAVKADDKLQKLTAKNNGSGSYLPTKIKRLERCELVPLTDDEQEEMYAAKHTD